MLSKSTRVLLVATILMAAFHALTSIAPHPATLKYRWVWVMTNLYRTEEVARVSALIRRAAAAGYNGIAFADTKLQSQSPAPDFYVKNLNEVLAVAKENHVSVIPCVLSYGYSNSMLALDPNLVEGMPIKNAPFVVKAGLAQLETTGVDLLSNGGMERANGDKMEGFAYQDGVGTGSFTDRQVFHGGSQSLRMKNPGDLKDSNGNCRIVADVKIAPWRQYHVSVWVKTKGLERAGNAHITILGATGKSLCFQDEGFQDNQDWTQVHATFNSQDNSTAKVYFGIWDGAKGTIWWDDAKVEEVGLLNVVRRAGCPLVVTGDDGIVYREGEDYARVTDPRFGNQPWSGAFEVFHEAPPIHIVPTGRIKDGQRLKVSFFASTSTGQDQDNICLSDPKTDELAKSEIARVDSLFHPEGFFFGYDEIRVMNWCDNCRKRGLTPGQMLAQSVKKSAALVEHTHPGATVFLWSDMFDKFHNAHSDYYLVNGDLTGSWLGLSDSTVVVNWNSGDTKRSLPFFNGLGCAQILAGYYDGSPDSIKNWLAQAKGVADVSGVMYTTWRGNYSGLEAFAKAAWGATSDSVNVRLTGDANRFQVNPRE